MYTPISGTDSANSMNFRAFDLIELRESSRESECSLTSSISTELILLTSRPAAIGLTARPEALDEKLGILKSKGLLKTFLNVKPSINLLKSSSWVILAKKWSMILLKWNLPVLSGSKRSNALSAEY